MDTQFLQAGTTLWHNSFRIEKVLGKGGFGITYLATDINLNTKVAIKEFFPSTFCHRDGDTSRLTVGSISNTELVEKLKAKFIKEARNIARFHHPNIIRIHTAFEENDTAYYVMDFIEGESLSDKVKLSGPLSLRQSLSLITKVGDALSYIHAKRINHLDVKPANIMLDKDDEPILIDFGLSKQYDSAGNQTSTTPVGISHGYAPMEQYNADGVKDFSPRSDLYSLAATLYFLLTANTPPSAPDLLDQPLSLPDRIPPHVQQAIRKAMSPGRLSRQESVTEFLDQLHGPSLPPADESTTLNLSGSNNNAHPEAKPLIVNTPYQPMEFATAPKKKSNPAIWLIPVVVILFALVLIFVALPDQSDNSVSIEDTMPASEEMIQEETTEAMAEGLSTNSSEGFIRNMIASNGGSYLMNGSFYNSTGSWPITLTFSETRNGDVIAHYKNVNYGSKCTLDVSFPSENAMYLEGTISHSSLIMDLVKYGNSFDGTVYTGSSQLSMELHP